VSRGARPARRRRHGVRAVVAGALVVVLAALVYVPVVLLAPLAPATAAAAEWTAPAQPGAQLTFPSYGATAVQAVGWDESLTTSGSTTPLPIASISKVVTALVVLDARPLDGGDVVGIKTGTLDEAGACLLFAADYTIAGESVTVVGVMLGGVDHDSLDADVQRLLTSVSGAFQTVTATTAGDVWASYELPWGAGTEAVAATDASRLVWGDVTVTASIETESVTTGAAGDDVGRVRFQIGDEEVDVPLVLDRALAEPDAWWRLTHPDEVLAAG
jgi:D-alanyl-D-alanine carboxypeptidase (penicillin-binding protein 5/6)